jgi:hypothetical protein
MALEHLAKLLLACALHLWGEKENSRGLSRADNYVSSQKKKNQRGATAID